MSSKICLHIDAQKLRKLHIDGPALAVVMVEKSEQLFPLRKLSRIHFTGTPKQGIEALVFCAQKHIPTTFFDGHGKIKALLYLPAESGTVLAHWLEMRHTDPAIAVIYDQWLENLSLHWQVDDAESERCKSRQDELIKSIKLLNLHEQWCAGKSWLDGIMRAQLMQCIDKFGLPAHTNEHRELLDDIGRLMQKMLKHEYNHWLMGQRSRVLSGAHLANFYQEFSEIVQCRTEVALSALQSAIAKIV